MLPSPLRSPTINAIFVRTLFLSKLSFSENFYEQATSAQAFFAIMYVSPPSQPTRKREKREKNSAKRFFYADKNGGDEKRAIADGGEATMECRRFWVNGTHTSALQGNSFPSPLKTTKTEIFNDGGCAKIPSI